MNGFQTTIDIPFQYHLPEHTDLSGFVFRLQRQVCLIPFTPDTHPLKTDLLFLNRFQRKCCRLLTQFQRRKIATLLRLQILDYFKLDRQSVTIPARNIAHLPPVEQLVTVDDILERLIERVTHVQRTIGIRRAIMQHKNLARIGL